MKSKGYTISYLERYKTDLEKDKLLQIATKYSFDDFVKKTLENLTYAKLLQFVIDKKYQDFNVFMQDFLNYVGYDSKITQLKNNGNLKIENTTYDIKFSFEVNPERTVNSSEIREIAHLRDVFEDFCWNAKSTNKNETEDFLVETKYNEFAIVFSPNWVV